MISMVYYSLKLPINALSLAIIIICFENLMDTSIIVMKYKQEHEIKSDTLIRI